MENQFVVEKRQAQQEQNIVEPNDSRYLFLSTRTIEKKNAIGIIHRVYLSQLKNRRVHTASTKTRSEVRGGGRKPWRQKGTGNARAGSTRSPLWVGGGVIFGPRPHLVSKKINKKERRLAILCAFSLKKANFVFVPDSTLENYTDIKTKNMVLFLLSLSIKTTEKILIILPSNNKKFWLSSRNLKNVEVINANCLNLQHLLNTKKIILCKKSFDLINSTYGNTNESS